MLPSPHGLQVDGVEAAVGAGADGWDAISGGGAVFFMGGESVLSAGEGKEKGRIWEKWVWSL